MNILEIIAKKRDGKELNKEEIEYFVKEYTNGNIPDYQASALVMAIYINGMNEREATDLSIAMAYSGDVLDLSRLGSNIVDKHSTGGVGDKVSIILLPIIASLGIPVAKMSGRGLGFTGGTVDKMESIPGYRTNIQVDEFISNVEKVGISMIGQTMNLAPADKKMYALRDTISCVESIPLIASSIMSKELMIKIGNLAGKEVVCVFTKMDEPLGNSVGNTLEVIEAVNFFKGYMPKDLKDVVFELGAQMIKLAGFGDDIENNKAKMQENIINGKAYEKLIQMVQNQGGDISYLNDTNKFEKAKYIIPVESKTSGIIKEINAEEVGKVACFLGAGRLKKEDKIDNSAGITLNKKVGDYVEEKEVIAYINTNYEEKIEYAKSKILEIWKIIKNVY